jgi:G3E family GTPase
MKVVGIISLGCCKNLTDSENILGILKNHDVVFSNKISQCDLIIINTCAFIESAKEEAIQTIFEVLDTKKKISPMLKGVKFFFIKQLKVSTLLKIAIKKNPEILLVQVNDILNKIKK